MRRVLLISVLLAILGSGSLSSRTCPHTIFAHEEIFEASIRRLVLLADKFRNQHQHAIAMFPDCLTLLLSDALQDDYTTYRSRVDLINDVSAIPELAVLLSRIESSVQIYADQAAIEQSLRAEMTNAEKLGDGASLRALKLQLWSTDHCGFDSFLRNNNRKSNVTWLQQLLRKDIFVVDPPLIGIKPSANDR